MRGRVVLACLCCVLASAYVARGQSNYAAVTGSVIHPQQLAISGATVEFKAAATGLVRRVVTNQNGIF